MPFCKKVKMFEGLVMVMCFMYIINVCVSSKLGNS